MSILGCHPVKIAENCEEFVASTKRKYIYFLYAELKKIEIKTKLFVIEFNFQSIELKDLKLNK